MNLRLEENVSANQPYMIANRLKHGLVVTTPVIEESPPAPATTLLQRWKEQWFGKPVLAPVAKVASPPKTLYLPYGKEQLIVVHNVLYLGPNDLKFCEINGMTPGQNFEGIETPLTYASNVHLFTEKPIKGYKYRQALTVTGLFLGDERFSRFVVQKVELAYPAANLA